MKLLAALFLACVAWQASQSTTPSIRIVEPTPETILTGRVTFSIVPVPGITRVTYYVDGLEVCRADKPPFACEGDAGNVRKSHDVRAVATLDGGRPPLSAALRTQEPPPTFRASVDAVLVPARVTDGRGRFVRGLTADDFVLLENGKPQLVTVLGDGDSGAEVMLVIDMSGSMTSVFAEMKGMVKQFLAALRPQDKVSVALFNSAFFLIAGRDTTPEEKAAKLDRVRPWGFTAIFDTLIQAVDQLAAQSGRKAIVLFTDGDDVSSQATIEGARTELQTHDVLLYLVATGKGATDRQLRIRLTDLAEETGGEAYFSGQLSGVAEHFATIAGDLSRQYLLSFSPERSLGDGGWRTISVKTTDRHYNVQARSGYIAAKRGQEK